MSIAEMKIVAIKEITNLENENALKEILDHLAKMQSDDTDAKVLNLSRHYDEIKNKFGNTLQKLAQ